MVTSLQKELYESMSDKDLIQDFRKYQEGSINQFEPHKACWDLSQRGAVGETILHLCYLNNTEVHKEIAKLLLKFFPSLVFDIYEGDDYYGR